MARISIYLNFMGNTEEAFRFYAQAFGTQITGMMHMKDAPGAEELGEDDREKIMNIELPILGGGVLMGTDFLESQGHTLALGNNVNINLEPDTLAEGQRLFDALSAGGNISMPLQPMFWGDTFGSFTDRYGIQWMVNCPPDSSRDLNEPSTGSGRSGGGVSTARRS